MGVSSCVSHGRMPILPENLDRSMLGDLSTLGIPCPPTCLCVSIQALHFAKVWIATRSTSGFLLEPVRDFQFVTHLFHPKLMIRNKHMCQKFCLQQVVDGIVARSSGLVTYLYIS